MRCDVDKVLAIVRDITERRRAERQARELRDELAHVGRVTTLAALTGSLAHEINQPLAAIMTNAQAARRLLDAPVPDLPSCAPRSPTSSPTISAPPRSCAACARCCVKTRPNTPAST